MYFNYLNLRDSLITYLLSANTTTATYDISAGLGKRVRTITAIDLDLTAPMGGEMPLIGVKLNSKEERLSSMTNNNARREIDVRFTLDMVYEDYASPQDHLIKLVSNVEANLRNNIDLTNWVSSLGSLYYMIPERVEFKTYIGEECPFDRSASLDLLCVCALNV